ncbi:hypothetical protein KQ876_00095 [Mycoplasma sp. CSL7491-lung]|uniref:hypothetical protein n=1 Tax=Mycoplasma sp. CSL7491-lung TaxID=549718 RepID=UPI001C107C11|nr:hypothetical protein [Mycoplasma sp. CSL7491-lung]MBU4692610.1 hypothetical protein [Mycoplasma sp. CSL7491-lung]
MFDKNKNYSKKDLKNLVISKNLMITTLVIIPILSFFVGAILNIAASLNGFSGTSSEAWITFVVIFGILFLIAYLVIIILQIYFISPKMIELSGIKTALIIGIFNPPVYVFAATYFLIKATPIIKTYVNKEKDQK